MDIRILAPGDAALTRVADDVFDRWIDADAARAFLADPRLHIAVAIVGDVVVGFASGMHYHHPDKPEPELFVNEVGVAPAQRGCGVGRAVVGALLAHGRTLGCATAWVLTDRTNTPARHMYAAAGGREKPPDPVMYEFDLR